MILKSNFSNYVSNLVKASEYVSLDDLDQLFAYLKICLKERRNIFLCGNGGSGANALHMENDFLYGVAKSPGMGARVHALTANSAVMTCLANDISYEEIFSEQLRVKAQANDLLIVLSGSGNSPNIIKALTVAKELGVKTVAILGFKGGEAKTIADLAIHTKIDDMQISEDMQTIILHFIMQELNKFFLENGSW